MNRISRHLSTKLGLGILLMAAPVFVITLGMLFLQSRYFIHNEATESFDRSLQTTLQRVRNYMSTIETATLANQWLAEHYFQPDSILKLSHRIVNLNRNVYGCSISAEPDMFPQCGRYYTVYSLTDNDSIITVREPQYEYFEKPWYKVPRELEKPCWIEPYDDYTEGGLKPSETIASYGIPLKGEGGRVVGIMSTDLSFERLAETVNEGAKDYENASFVLVGSDGRYFIPSEYEDKINLSCEQTGGQAGTMHVDIGGKVYHVSHCPVPGTSWTLALICSDDDILASCRHLTYLAIALIVIGLLVILWLCRIAVNHAIRPLSALNASSKKIAEGRYDEVIPHTQREDAVGQLQNSFATMTEALVEHVDSIRQTTEETKQSNEELVHAMEMAREAVRQKTEFIQNVSHQIRTPLNIIQGFAQVLNSGETLPEEERKTVTTTMKHNAVHLNRMVLMLFDSSDTGSEEELRNIRDDKLFCNAIASECISLTETRFPEHTVAFETEVPDSLQIVTSHLYLSRSLLELLYNALKYSDGEHVKLRVTQTEKTVCFTVEDRGMGMPEEWQEKLYKPFVKVNSLSEGLGLGLSLTMRHAIRLGGTLKLDTTYHDGCRFTMEMPK
jgi:signal transduction histidine kinase/predicted small secreted protein